MDKKPSKNAAWVQNWRLRQRAAGKCCDCTALAIPGQSRCRRHQLAAYAALRRFRMMQKSNMMRKRNAK